MQHIMIIGNLTRDPEHVTSDRGTEYCKMTVAVNERGDRDTPATFYTVSVYGAQGDACERYLSKGRKVAVCGRLRLSKFLTRDGEAGIGCWVQAHEVEFIGGPQRDDAPGNVTGHEIPTGSSPRLSPPKVPAKLAQMGFAQVDDDDNPFG